MIPPEVQNNYAVHIGEQIVNDVLNISLSGNDYALLSNVTLPFLDKDNRAGTSQVDHVLISSRGLFVIETKFYRGSIVGTADSKNWYQYTSFDKHTFQNPIRQNFSHLMAIEAITGYSHDDMINVVTFSGDAAFKSERPSGVVKSSELRNYIESFPRDKLTMDQVYRLAGQLQVNRLPETETTDATHIDYLKESHKKRAA
ncbi:nuclease-related domain-containing protein [Methylophaga pinxianii]|uniref:nuclease-related domain-containing protein n=1 Tax=Methylophaga pinxianii TaxID=2881052 RepID=UPI001CF463AE|nr:nuclease-related domain-containing protein [Methylophaga pinxianii]MCB2425846.1 NERD domain-containing protein [Methylophaga pinxianii]UPH47253.1 NERD domain-containing protein [Methylophaga pinxianii]